MFLIKQIDWIIDRIFAGLGERYQDFTELNWFNFCDKRELELLKEDEMMGECWLEIW